MVYVARLKALNGVFTLHFSQHLSLWSISRLVFGILAFGVSSESLQAQTYYYYPTSAAPTTATQYYYYPAGYTIQAPALTYTPQYYYTPQTAQPAYTYASYQPTYVVQPAQAEAVAPAAPATTTAVAPQATPAAVAQPAAEAPVSAGDPYGFTAWLNSTRAAYGLAPVGYDPNLAGWAAANNDQQAARGMGHHVMGPATRQNSAVGGFPGVESMWMASPAHRAALLDPTIRWIGIAGLGAYWTFNAN
jgi:uncharacterized protein YkwD